MVELLIKHYRKFDTHTQDRGKKQGTSKLRLSMNNCEKRVGGGWKERSGGECFSFVGQRLRRGAR